MKEDVVDVNRRGSSNIDELSPEDRAIYGQVSPGERPYIQAFVREALGQVSDDDTVVIQEFESKHEGPERFLKSGARSLPA